MGCDENKGQMDVVTKFNNIKDSVLLENVKSGMHKNTRFNTLGQQLVK